jgi:hypothetical protein
MYFMSHSKKIIVIGATLVALFGASFVAYAQTTTPSLEAENAQLKAKIIELESTIAMYKEQIAQFQTNNKALFMKNLQLTSQLKQGMSGAGVKQLQAVLATDPDLLSKQNITGFFGPITAKAVEKFQRHFGLDPVGAVGPRTLEKVNGLLKGHENDEDLTEGELGDLGGPGDDANEVEHEGGTGSSSASGGRGESGTHE